MRSHTQSARPKDTGENINISSAAAAAGWTRRARGLAIHTHIVRSNWCISMVVMVTHTHTHSHREKERRPGAERCPPRYAAARTLHKSRLPVHIMCSIGAYTLFQCAVCSANNIKPQFNAQFIIGRAQRIFRATRAAADHCFDYLLHRTHRGDALRVISRQTKHHQQPGRE